jgi:hypothetical protein
VPKGILASLPANPLQWQELSIFKVKPENVSSFEVTKGDELANSLVREKDQWKLAKGDAAVNQVNAQSLINTVSSLSAVRWVGRNSAGTRLREAVATVSFKDEQGGAYKLIIGAKTPEEMWYATAEGKNGTFLLSRPDVEAAELPLIEKAASAQPSSPTNSDAPEAAAAGRPWRHFTSATWAFGHQRSGGWSCNAACACAIGGAVLPEPWREVLWFHPV